MTKIKFNSYDELTDWFSFKKRDGCDTYSQPEANECVFPCILVYYDEDYDGMTYGWITHWEIVTLSDF